ncbi:EF-P beta-lysylation protein EpmB [Alkalilimnicola ehrlichii]|nr:EF-P beta-lysylation protein EpmB [Alkalilimnicola ehrlichii]
MRPGEPNDPLLRQVLPLGVECNPAADFLTDPVGDLQAMTADGVLHKYHGRVLLVLTGACAIHCRYCFRRHFPYAEAHAGRQRWQDALNYLYEHPEVDEVILSGGDPLSLNDRRLSDLAQKLAAIPHLKRLRIHSRLPIVLPERLTDDLLAWFAGNRLQPIMVVHANHAQEIDQRVAEGLLKLKQAGVTLLNQTVLLRGINDSAAHLSELSHRLFETGTLPYYLHLLDKVQGAAHFDIPEAEAKRLLAELSTCLPGYLTPKLVKEEAGKPNKTLLPPRMPLADETRSG